MNRLLRLSKLILTVYDILLFSVYVPISTLVDPCEGITLWRIENR